MIVGHIGGGSVGGYQVQRSVRLRSAASAYFNRTLGTATNRRRSTLSMWVKRGSLGRNTFFGSYVSGTDRAFLEFDSSDRLTIDDFFGAQSTLKTSTAVFRDTSAWYHIVLVYDTANATAEDRTIIYVNGSRITSWANNTICGQNIDPSVNGPRTHFVGALGSGTSYFDGYVTEVNFIDGQALTPSAFGEQDAATRMWVPKKYTGSFGTNGFYLDFSDITSTTTLGYDKSGNGNNWTANNISLTSGSTYDSMLDVPGLPWADGGNGRGNYCTLSPLDKDANITFSDGNLTSTGYNAGGSASLGLTTGKWYWEVSLIDPYNGGSTNVYWGNHGLSAGKSSSYSATNANGAGVYASLNASDGGTWASGSRVTSQTTWANGDVIGFAFDATNLTLDVYRNNVKIGSTLTVPSSAIYPSVLQNGTSGDTSSAAINFGQRPFAFTPPTGFKALNTANLPDPTGAAAKPWEHFDVRLWVGNGSTQNITGLAFQPDMVWPKARSAIRDNRVVDSVRGVTKSLQPNLIDAELTEVNGLTAFLSNGFSLGSQNGFNALNETHVGWCWKAGGTAVTNNSGTISSQVSANTQAGVSVVTYTGTGANATVGHGLGVVPKMVIVKRRNSTGDWPVWNQNVAAGGSDRVLFLNTTDAQTVSGTNFNSSSPTSSVINIGTNPATNASGGTYVAYCFAEVPGFSKFGSYTGTGTTDGPNIVCGFKPKYVLLKCSSNAGLYWFIFDSARNTYNVLDAKIGANASDAESTGQTNLDFTANGFKVRTDQTSTNGSGYTYVYMAFSESPFKYSNAR